MRLGKMGKMRFAARTLGSTRYGGFYVLPEEKIAQNTRISGQVVHKTDFFVYYLQSNSLLTACYLQSSFQPIICDITQFAPPDFLSRFLVHRVF